LTFDSCILIVSLLFIMMAINTIAVTLYYPGLSLGQTISGNGTQLWIDRENNVKVQFTYSPQTPIVDTPTELKFSVQNLQSGANLKNLAARVVVVNNSSGQERSFKFTNISSPDGNFSVKYLFPDSGVYQVISRTYSKDAPTLASFKVTVPFQPLGVLNTNNMNPLILPAILVAVVGAIAVASFLIIMRRARKLKV
jgi:uncharacterized integral membrane protein